MELSEAVVDEWGEYIDRAVNQRIDVSLATRCAFLFGPLTHAMAAVRFATRPDDRRWEITARGQGLVGQVVAEVSDPRWGSESWDPLQADGHAVRFYAWAVPEQSLKSVSLLPNTADRLWRKDSEDGSVVKVRGSWLFELEDGRSLKLDSKPDSEALALGLFRALRSSPG